MGETWILGEVGEDAEQLPKETSVMAVRDVSRGRNPGGRPEWGLGGKGALQQPQYFLEPHIYNPWTSSGKEEPGWERGS